MNETDRGDNLFHFFRAHMQIFELYIFEGNGTDTMNGPPYPIFFSTRNQPFKFTFVTKGKSTKIP